MRRITGYLKDLGIPFDNSMECAWVILTHPAMHENGNAFSRSNLSPMWTADDWDTAIASLIAKGLVREVEITLP